METVLQLQICTSEDSTFWKEVVASTDKGKWINAIEKEVKSIHTNEVWDKSVYEIA